MLRFELPSPFQLLHLRPNPEHNAQRFRGFTIVETIVVIVIVVLLVGILLPSIGHTHHHDRGIRDGTQIRGIHQGLVLFAQNNGDEYPLPSKLDVENLTIDAPADTKNTTGNIVSILVYQQFFTPELCVSPSEINPAIRIDANFQYTDPSTAAKPTKALWDPGFNADFTLANPARIAAFSYAHQMPFAKRRERKWNNSFGSNDAMIANRGPKISSVALSDNPDKGIAFDRSSNTLLIHGARTTWEGNVAYNDNSIQFETSLSPENKTWSERPDDDTTGKPYKSWRDCLFFDEPQDPNGINNLLVNVNKVGADGPSTIWD